MKVFIALMLVLLTSCQTMSKVERKEKPRIIIVGEIPIEIPLKYHFNMVYAKRYVLSVYDCSNKSAHYGFKIWKELGIEFDIVAFDMKGYPKGESIHAVVRIKQNGRYVYLDPTHNTTTDDLSEWGTELLVFNRQELLTTFLEAFNFPGYEEYIETD